MASEHWFRWHHGSVTDPKWRVIASRCVTNVTVGHVVTVWAAMLENASQSVPRGTLSGWDDEDIAVLFGYEVGQVSAIRNAMQGKVLDGDRLLSWEKRQPKREDSSTERTRNYRSKQRDRKNTNERDVTHGDKTKQSVTLGDSREEESREEQEHELPIGNSSPSAGAEGPASRTDPIPYQAIVDTLNRTLTRLPKARTLTPKRRTLIRSAWQAGPERRSIEFWQALAAEYESDDFTNGTGPYLNGHEGWRPTIDYLLRADVVTRTFERAMDRLERGA